MRKLLLCFLMVAALVGCRTVDEAYQGAHPTDNCMERYQDWVNQERCKVDQRDGG